MHNMVDSLCKNFELRINKLENDNKKDSEIIKNSFNVLQSNLEVNY
jgi:hypothetical protein